MAWTWLARAITSGEPISEPGIAALRHLEHVVPTLGCPYCPGAATGMLGRIDQGSHGR
jgi:hypothetical protein